MVADAVIHLSLERDLWVRPCSGRWQQAEPEHGEALLPRGCPAPGLSGWPPWAEQDVAPPSVPRMSSLTRWRETGSSC